MIAKALRTAVRIPVFLLFLCLANCTRSIDPDLVFIAAADWRYTAMEEYRTPGYFMGTLQAIAEVGKGSFMVSPGDIEPVSSSQELIAQILGDDYVWYPVIGNHELDSENYIDYLRKMNTGDKTLPNIVHTGPPGSVETTYSFEWGDCHFVVLNQYFDGRSDTGTDGDIVPELLAWLEQDLAQNTKRHIFVIGHEPMIALPDMHSGRLRHQGDSLDKYAKNMFRFHQLLLKYNIVAYICGHTHNTSIGKINDVWQIDVGHARGTEEPYPAGIYKGVTTILEGMEPGDAGVEGALKQYYAPRKYEVKKALYYAELTDGIYYKELDDEGGFKVLQRFYSTVKEDPSSLEKYCSAFWENFGLTRSTFVRIVVDGEEVVAQIYRNDALGGAHTLAHTEILN